ncbi:MAG: potassium transporter Kup [Desulfovibrio sp.]|uniref:potassium transporter Kup n=1 Tax=Desulfovibrio sp. 7SRBS1 TaxID=3378064 RepID=UPI003B41F59B
MNNSNQNTDETPPQIVLSLAALGVVFGDIGTSPLYAFKACFNGPHGLPLTPENVVGILSLIFWSLLVVIGLKYTTFVMRADNKGEGGIFALFALLPASGKRYKTVMAVALFGAALLYGDGFITPAISVLSALEGLDVATRAADAYVEPITCVILFVLFLAQRHGTSRIGSIFGPVMLLWFLVLGVLGVRTIALHPDVFVALNPMQAVDFFLRNGVAGAVVLGAVVLCVTGGEALYADMGHFGRKPIVLAWYCLVLPALCINYFGQGALILTHPETVTDPFYGLVPRMLLYPMVGLSALATVIASQAVISGAFSLTRQAIQLGYLPRIVVTHTSESSEGQVYCPAVNYVMMVVCIILVLIFHNSEALAGAYGMAITATMVITTWLFGLYLRSIRGWSLPAVLGLCTVFMVFDLGFFAANLTKLTAGGWIPLLVGAAVMGIMLSWRNGRRVTRLQLEEMQMSEEDFLAEVHNRQPPRVPGAGVILTVSPINIPPILVRHLRLNKALHERVILLSIITEPVPRVESSKRLVIRMMDDGLVRVIARYGFMQQPNVPLTLANAYNAGLQVDPGDITYYLGRELFSFDSMRRGRTLYRFMAINAVNPALYFGIPRSQVIEMGIAVNV